MQFARRARRILAAVSGGREGRLVRWAFLFAAALALAACSLAPERLPDEASAATVAKVCADRHWKAANLGLWYSICRKPVNW